MTVINSEGKLFLCNLPILAFREVDECPPPVEPFPYTSPAHLDTHQCTETRARSGSTHILRVCENSDNGCENIRQWFVKTR